MTSVESTTMTFVSMNYYDPNLNLPLTSSSRLLDPTQSDLYNCPVADSEASNAIYTESLSRFSQHARNTFQQQSAHDNCDSVAIQSPEFSNYSDPDMAVAAGRDFTNPSYDGMTSGQPVIVKCQESTSDSYSSLSPAMSSKDERSKEKNRIAASRCREKSKKNIEELRSREQQLSEQREVLMAQAFGLKEEVLSLKNEILKHGDCDDDVIQGYLKKAAKRMA